MTAFAHHVSNNTTARVRSVCPAKTRKRFYVVKSNAGALQIINLRHLLTDVTFSHVWIHGPFRTFNDAVIHLENQAGVKAPYTV